jgi:tetratricopeptide (TPR) repeat protein
MEMALKQLIQIAPNNALAYNALGYSYADRNMQLDQALALIEAANQLNPNDPYILDSLGWVKYRLKEYADAERYLRLSLGMRQDADVSVHLAEILWVQNKKDEALQLFSEARKRDPDNTLLKSTLQRLELKLP